MEVRRDNLTEFAARLGISATTVSRVLAGKGDAYRIARKTQERVLAEARESGLRLNQVARGLRMRKTHTLGIVVPDIANPFFASLAQGIERRAREKGYSILLANSEESTEIEIEVVDLMAGREVDGLIVAPVGIAADHLESLVRSRKPMVLVDRAFVDLAIPSVVSDNYSGGRLAVAHLAAAGHRHLVCLQGTHTNEANRERVRGFRDGLLELGLPFSEGRIVGGDYAIERGYEATVEALNLHPRPTGFVALGNLIALGALRAFRDRSIRVPDDVSIVSYDEQPWAAVLSPPLTTIAQPVEDIARSALEMLLARIEGKEGEVQHLVLPVALVARESVGPPPAAE